MIREYDRYLVLKQQDLWNVVTDEPQLYDAMLEILQRVTELRLQTGRTTCPNYVVVKDTWPEYETVWEMIEKRVHESK